MILRGDARHIPLRDECVQTVVTSPPYWGPRDYQLGDKGIGLERTLEEYVAAMVEVFREERRVLKPDGTVWLNLGDCYHSGDRGGYRKDSHRWENSPMQSQVKGSHLEAVSPNRLPQAGLKDKDLVGMPWRVAFALQADGWWLRSDIIWAKPNPMPESVTDRPTRSHDYVFLLSKSASYYYNADAIREKTGNEATQDKYRAAKTQTWPSGGITQYAGSLKGQFVPALTNPAGRNKRDVWIINSEPTPESHFATFPQALVMPCILAGSRPGDLVLDPFGGSSTVGIVAERLGRRWATLELSAEYIAIAKRRTAQRGLFAVQRKIQGTLL